MARKKAKQLSLLQDPRYAPFVARYSYDIDRFAIEVFGIEPTPQQEAIFASVELPGSRTSVSSGHGCFGAGTTIMRVDGSTIAVEDVRVGDRLMGPDGDSMRTVLELRRGQEAMYRFTYVDGSSHVFNESHLLCLIGESGELVRVCVREWLMWSDTRRAQFHCYRLVRPGCADLPPGYAMLAIASHEALGVGDYFGFTLDGDHRFLGGDFTVLSNTGKTNGFSIIALWHLLCYAMSNTVITGPKLQTVQEGVWKEFADQMIRIQEGPHAWIAEHIIVKATKVSIRGYQANWWIVPKTAPRGRPESLAGQHRKYLMWIADEASGIPDANFGVITGSLTEEDNRMVMASQPTRPTGYFYDTHHKLSIGCGGFWCDLTLNSEESPLVSDAFLMQKLAEYGGSREDPQYMIKVRGLFPENLEGQLLGRSTLEACVGARPVIQDGEEYGWVVLVDVGAGEYRDKSVVVVAKVAGYGQHHEPDPRRMHVVRIPICSNTIQPSALVAEVMNIAGALSNATVLIDGGGLGLGVVKRLQEIGVPNVVKVLWGNPCFKRTLKETFFNQRAQAQVSIARAAKAGYLSFERSAFDDVRHLSEMLDQGSRIPYHFDDKARYVIEPKGSSAWEGMPSPDIWDSCSFGFLEDATYIVSEAITKAIGGAKADSVSRMQKLLEAAGVTPNQ